ncbi:MAG: hypothetical protein LBU88_01310 [Treponema sp.]|jgi:hypothetical protein|nr:hypothetical protein [Treponema sp.]
MENIKKFYNDAPADNKAMQEKAKAQNTQHRENPGDQAIPIPDDQLDKVTGGYAPPAITPACMAVQKEK